MRVRLTTEADGRICLESPFDRAFVESLKLALDYGGRDWDAARKRWIISVLYADVLVQFLQNYGAIIIDDREVPQPQDQLQLTAPPPMPLELRDAFDCLFLAYGAPLCVAVSAYKALAKYHHPDKGGDPAAFHAVNDAIAIIRHYLDPLNEDEFLF